MSPTLASPALVASTISGEQVGFGSLQGQFGITTQPAFAFINDDGSVDSQLGAMGFDSLTAEVDELIEP